MWYKVVGGESEGFKKNLICLAGIVENFKNDFESLIINIAKVLKKGSFLLKGL